MCCSKDKSEKSVDLHEICMPSDGEKPLQKVVYHAWIVPRVHALCDRTLDIGEGHMLNSIFPIVIHSSNNFHMQDKIRS